MGTKAEALAPPIAQEQESLPEFMVSAAADQSSIPDAVAQGYEYAHTDGTVHHAESAESARAACPVLGKMALNEVNLLLEVAAIGQQKLKEERPKEEQKPPEPQKRKPEKEPVSEKTVEHARLEPAQTTSAERMAATGKVNETSIPVADSKPVPASRTMTEKNSTQSVEAPLPVAKTPAKEVATSVVHEPSTLRDAEHRIAHATHAAHLDAERTYAVATGATTALDIDKSVPSQAIAVNEVALEHVYHNQELQTAPAEEFVTALNYEIAHAVEGIETTTEPETFEATLVTDETDLPALIPEDDSEFEEFILPIMSELGITEEADMPEVKLSTVRPFEQATWADELEKESEEIYEDFTQALQTLIALPMIEQPRVVADEEVTVATELGGDNEAQTEQPIPAIVATVAERLSELAQEDKEIAVPLIRDIVEAVHTIDLLEMEEATPEAVETVQAELEELVINLFEQLGIEYELEDIEQFVSVLLRPDFQPPQTEELLDEADLENDGTHEAKRSFTQVVSDVAEDVERDIKLLIGIFALFQATDRHAA